jgi:hypothetical protein
MALHFLKLLFAACSVVNDLAQEQNKIMTRPR